MIGRALALLTVLAVAVGIVSLTGAPSPGLAAGLAAGRVHEEFQPQTGKVFVLVIGNDARPGERRSRADAIHLVGVNTETMKGAILNFPRDSWVEIPGYGSGKINEALYHGGPLLVARTVEKLTGIRIDYWAMTGFEGFQRLVGGVGGVTMRIPTRIYDPYGSGADLHPGRQRLGARKALAYVRTRHSFVSGDIARTRNQGTFLLALLKRFHEQVERDPAAMLHWLSLTRKHVSLDMSSEEVFRLGILASQLKARDIANVTVPASAGMAGAASVVFIAPDARRIYERFARRGTL